MTQQSSSPTDDIPIKFEIVPLESEIEQVDIADIDEVGQEFVDELRKKQYSVNPTYTGKKGGPVFDILLQIPQFIHDNREVLLAIFDSISLSLQCLLLVRDQRAEREKDRRAPLEFVLEVNGKPITITAHNARSGIELLESYQEAHPEEVKKSTSKSTMKVKANVPKKRRRHSH